MKRKLFALLLTLVLILSLSGCDTVSKTEDAIAQIYEIQGNIAGAIEMQKAMRTVILEDWATEGEIVDSIDREIERLQKLL